MEIEIMKIALISIPMPTFNNRGAASALPYHLIKGVGKDARFEVWTYNSNHIPPSDVAEMERALGCKKRFPAEIIGSYKNLAYLCMLGVDKVFKIM